jgi:hypothetical protein
MEKISFLPTLQRQFRLYIPFPPAEQADPSREYIILSQIHECGNWD